MEEKIWMLKIYRGANGFSLLGTGYGEENASCHVIEESETKPWEATQDLLYFVMDYFALEGTRYDKQRVCVTLKKGDKHEEPEDPTA